MSGSTTTGSRLDLLHGRIGSTILRLATPMAIGLAAILLFNVVDTVWVGRLGAEPLAAMGFTFPVTYFVMSVSMGLSVGMTSVVSRRIGQAERRQVRRLVTDGLVLANTLVVGVAVIGVATIKPLFRALGAAPEMIALIDDYMFPWYAGVGFLVIPMVGNGAIRATGDTRSPSLIMMLAGLVNVVLDPLLIFGIGPFPRLELQGAALATVVSWVVAFVASLWILGKRDKLITLRWPGLRAVIASWRSILSIGLPAAGAQVLVPTAAAVLTRLVAMFGVAAVAAFGAAMRLESFALLGMMAMASAMTPFVGQNFGAGNRDRIRDAIGFGLRGALVYGIAVTVLFAPTAVLLARLFNEDPTVRRLIAWFLWIVVPSYGFFGALLMVNSTFNALHRPLRAAMLIALRLFVLALPLAWIGSRVAGMLGLFAGVAIANLIAGSTAVVTARRFVSRCEMPRPGAKPAPPGPLTEPVSP